MVIPFQDCVARPEQNEKAYLLTNHLEKVAEGWSQYQKGHLKVLYQLGGYCHDAGKGQYSWQQYIGKAHTKRGEGPPHAPLGSFIFTYLAEAYILAAGINERDYFFHIARIARDIDDHHGTLQDIDEQQIPWNGMVTKKHLMEIDWSGFHTFIEGKISILKGYLDFDVDKMLAWEKAYKEKWKSLLTKRRLLRSGDKAKAALICLRSDTASFITSDRIDAADMTIEEADQQAFLKAQKKIGTAMHEKAKGK